MVGWLLEKDETGNEFLELGNMNLWRDPDKSLFSTAVGWKAD